MKKLPKLRFKPSDGGEYPDWEEKTLGRCFDFISGSTPRKENKDYFKGEILWVTSGELKKKYISDTVDKISVEAKNDTNLKIYPKGTFLIAIYGLEATGTRGSCSILEQNATISQACMVWLPKGLISMEFTYYWYLKYGEYIGLTYAQGTKQQNLSNDILNTIKFFLPSLSEQEKIAEFLSAVDEKIEVRTQKVEKLKTYKKAVMQKLFSQELRFKAEDGSDYPEWEEKTLGEVLLCESSNISDNQITEDFGVYPIYGATGLIKKISFYSKENDYISIVKDGAGVGRLLYCNGKSSILSTLQYLFSKNEVLLKYIYYALLTIDLTKFKVGSTIPHIYFKDYSASLISIPCLAEQQKIADFLSAIDEKIEVNEKMLERVKEWKKGLLQQMFV